VVDQTNARVALLPQPRSSITITKPAEKGDLEAKAVAVSYSPVGVLADASEVTGLPRDTFEVHEISKAEFEDLRGRQKTSLTAYRPTPGSGSRRPIYLNSRIDFYKSITLVSLDAH
jgi:hypothetical protein